MVGWQDMLGFDDRFVEVDSEKEMSMALAGKKSRRNKGKADFVSDELYFHNDLQQYRDNGKQSVAYEEYSRSSDEDGMDSSWYSDRNRSGSGANLVPAKTRQDRESDLLLERALDRISKARAKGKPSVNLTHEELAALERRNSGQREAPRPRSARNNPREAYRGQDSNSSGDSPVNEIKSRKRTHRKSGYFSATPSPRPKDRGGKGSRSDTEGKSTARSYRDDTPPRERAKAPVSYFNSRPLPDRHDAYVRRSKKISSPPLSSTERFDDRGPPYPTGASSYRAYNPNMAVPRDREAGYRSEGAHRTSSLPDDIDRFGRRLQPPYPVPEFLAPYAIPSGNNEVPVGGMPPAARHPSDDRDRTGRRIVSGPSADYAHTIRRVPVPLSARVPASESDPVLGLRHSGPPRGDDESGDSDDESDDEDDDEAGGRERVSGRERDQARRVREVRDPRRSSVTPPSGGNGVGRTRSGSVGWQRRKR